MYCRNCNQQIPDGAVFCPHCGTPQQAQQNAPVYEQPVNEYQQPVNNSYEQPAVPYQAPVNNTYEQPAAPYQAPMAPDYSQGQNTGFQQMPPMNPAFQQPAPKKKSKAGLIIGIICGVIGLLIIGIVVLGFVYSASHDTYEDSYVDSYEEGESALADSYDDYDDYDDTFVFSAAFQQILDDNELSFTRYEFDYPDYSVYGKIDENGMIDIQEMGSDGDTVYEMYETILVPTTGFSQEDIAGLDENMRESFASYENLDFCLVDYYEIEDFYVVELYVWDLDSAVNLQKLQDLGFVQDGFVLYLSLSATEQSLLGTGYVKG